MAKCLLSKCLLLTSVNIQRFCLFVCLFWKINPAGSNSLSLCWHVVIFIDPFIFRRIMTCNLTHVTTIPPCCFSVFRFIVGGLFFFSADKHDNKCTHEQGKRRQKMPKVVPIEKPKNSAFFVAITRIFRRRCFFGGC